MAALLAAQAVVVGQHVLQDVAVAHLGLHVLDAQLLQRQLQAHVAHDGGDHGIVAQPSLLLEVIGADAHHLVAVDHPAPLIHGHEAVRVPVEGQTYVRAQLPHQLAQPLGVGGAAVLVDVGAVRLMVVGGYLRAQLLQHRRGHLVAGALGAVHHNVQPVQAHAGGLLGKVDVAALGVALAHRSAHALADGQLLALGQTVLHNLLDLVLNGVGQLVALAVEELDAVVFDGIVAGGDHRARVRLIVAGQVGDGRGGQHVHQHGPRTHGADARHQRALQHFTADAGVPPHQDGRAVDVAGQHAGRRLAQLEGQLACQILIGDAPHAVGTE